MDGQTSMMIARNSNLAAEEARRDSASMKTIAIVTLVFLPGTSLAVSFLTQDQGTYKQRMLTSTPIGNIQHEHA